MSPNQVIFETKRAGVLLLIPGQKKCKPGQYPRQTEMHDHSTYIVLKCQTFYY